MSERFAVGMLIFAAVCTWPVAILHPETVVGFGLLMFGFMETIMTTVAVSAKQIAPFLTVVVVIAGAYVTVRWIQLEGL